MKTHLLVIALVALALLLWSTPPPPPTAVLLGPSSAPGIPVTTVLTSAKPHTDILPVNRLKF